MIRRTRFGAGAAALMVVAAGCSAGRAAPAATSPTTSEPPAVTTTTVVVPPDLGGKEFLVQVAMTDDGFEPGTILLPAGRHVRLVLRNRGSTEHHFRVKKLVPVEMRWLLEPDLDISNIDEMSDAELAEYGLTGEDATDEDVEHILHHLEPTFVPGKEKSPSGIKPLPTEVHGYAVVGGHDVLSFFALTTGRYEVEDVLHPEITGTVIVFSSD